MFACIYIPDFPVAAIVRAEPALRDCAGAVLDGKPPQVRVLALNEKARLLGMEAGMTKLQAAFFNSALLRQRSPAQEDSAHAALLDVAHAFTPRVEDTHPDRLLLDLGGLERLYGAAPAMARQLASHVSSVGLDCNIGMAVNPDAAMHAACGFSGITVIPVGEEARRLGVLPITVLLDSLDLAHGSQAETSTSARERNKLREQMLDTLERWGVRDFRTLALLPEHALASRLGAAGTRLQQLSRGAGTRTLALCEPQMHFEEAMELESSVENLEPLSFLLNRLIEQMCTRLEARALAAQELTLRLQLEPRVADDQTTTLLELGKANEARDLYIRTLRLPVAMRDPKVFLKLLQLDLAAHPPGAPVCKLWLAAEPARPGSAQRGLFLPITPEAEKLEITLARIHGVVGKRRAGVARVLDTYRPDAFCMERFAPRQEDRAPGSDLTLSELTDAPVVALRIFRPARPVRVQLVEGRPYKLAATDPHPDHGVLQGIILWSAGPWRSSGDWWAEPPASTNSEEDARTWSREEWDIALASDNGEGAALYRIYRDTGTGQWFADASYD